MHRALASLTLALFLITGFTSADGQSIAKIRLATLPIDVASEAFYAADQGFFKAAGLDVDVAVMSNGPAIAAAVSGGDIEIGSSNLVTLASAYEKGVPIVLVAPAGGYTFKSPTDKLLVANGSPIKTARDLNGKTIAVNALKNIDYISTRAWIDRHGGDSSSVKFIEVSNSAMSAAVEAGRVDAAAVNEPFLRRGLAENHLRVLASPYEAIGKAFLSGAWFSTLAYAQAHPDALRRFGDAMTKAGAWANANTSASAAIFEKYTKTALVPGTARTYFPLHFFAGETQPLLDAAAKYGVLKQSVPVRSMLAPNIPLAN